MKYEYIEYVQR